MVLSVSCLPNEEGWVFFYEFIRYSSTTVTGRQETSPGYYTYFFEEMPETIIGRIYLDDQDQASRWRFGSNKYFRSDYAPYTGETYDFYSYTITNGLKSVDLGSVGLLVNFGYFLNKNPGFSAGDYTRYTDSVIVDYRFYYCGDSVNCCCDCPMPRSLPELIASKLMINYA